MRRVVSSKMERSTGYKPKTLNPKPKTSSLKSLNHPQHRQVSVSAFGDIHFAAGGSSLS